ncbi:MAG: efflux RND transporter periplasmic adaptor subunit [Anaerolineales bacterium]|nr:MAG: efflux RND transporter periplasmic adaptor subunit [Anaerolineales bacterium]
MRKWIVAIVLIAIVSAGAYFIWTTRNQQQAAATDFQLVAAGRGSLTATVGATGEVRANQTATLNWQTSGTVGRVNILVGDTVTTGQILASIEQTSLPQSIILAQADLVNAQKALEDVLNSKLQQAMALQAVEDAQQALEDALNPELAQARASEAITNAQKSVELAERNLRWTQSPASQSYIDEAEAQVVLAKDQLDKAKEKFAPYENKPEDNLTRARLQTELSAAQQQYDFAARQLNSLTGTASETDQAIAQANLETARAQLLQAQRDWERIKDGPSQAEIALLEAQLADAQREWERLKDGPDPDDIAAAEARVAAAQASLRLTQLEAPFAGVVTVVNGKPGDQVTPGVQALRLDDLSRLLVDVQVSEVDINRIQVGQQAIMVFDGILDREYQGIVTEVSLVGSLSQGIVDFTVTIELTDLDQAVKPGMTAAVNIVVSQLEDVLLVPNRAVRALEGKRVVYILQNGSPEPLEITLGASSETMSQVIEGELKEGDQIIINPPTVFEQNGPPPFVQR